MSERTDERRDRDPERRFTQAPPAPIRPWPSPDSEDLGDWIHVAADGSVTAFTGKVELGQNSRTSLTLVVAEELRVSPEVVQVTLGDSARGPFDIGTFGSRTTPIAVPKLRQAAATARELLLDLAAVRLEVDRARLVAADGRVSDQVTGRSIGYGELTEGEPFAGQIDQAAPLTPPEKWTVAGKEGRKLAGLGYVTGQHRHAYDVTRPGMLLGRVVRPPRHDATLVSADTSVAEAMPGVIVSRDGDFVGVAGPDRLTVDRAAASVRAEWSIPPQRSTAELFEYLRTAPVDEEYRIGSRPQSYASGDVAAGRALAEHELKTTYTVAYIAHSPLEPRTALAEWEGDRLVVWMGSNRPFGAAADLAAFFSLPEEQVRVIVPDGTANYGGKGTSEAGREAALLARAAGRPVKVSWTREEEFSYAYARPAGVIDVSSAARADGTLTAWEHDTYGSGPQGMTVTYAVANQRLDSHPVPPALRVGSYRALAATANHFARECHLDELAHLLGLDPLEIRLRNISDARLRAVLLAATERFGWGRKPTEAGRGYGLAVGAEKNSVVATCVEVAVDPVTSALRLVRIVEAFECGAIVSQDGLRNQVEGAIVQAIGGALFERLEFENGQITNGRFSDYRVPRFGDVPPIEMVLLDRPDLAPIGGGETPMVSVAPAIGNAIFDATGVRLRGMPLLPTGAVEEAARRRD